MERIYKKSAGIDVHKKIVVCTILNNIDGKVKKLTKEFKTFRMDLEALAKWLASEKVETVVMESTSVYWYSVYEAIEDQNLPVMVVNARHVKAVPGRKTDVLDSEWLADLAMCGLLRKSLVPSKDMRELRVISRYRSKVVSMIAAEKCRLGKYLDAAGVRLSSIISNIDGVAAKSLIDALLKGTLTASNISLFIPKRARLKANMEELTKALECRLSDRHRFTLMKIRDHLRYLQEMVVELDEQIVGGMTPYEKHWKLLQTMPGLDSHTAAILLIETGGDMSQFSSVEKFCSWAGICPGNNESAGKKKVQGLARRTNT